MNLVEVLRKYDDAVQDYLDPMTLTMNMSLEFYLQLIEDIYTEGLEQGYQEGYGDGFTAGSFQVKDSDKH